MEKITLLLPNGFNSTIEFVGLDNDYIDVWHTTDDGKETNVNGFVNIAEAKEWVLNTFLPNHYASYEIIN